MLRIITLTSGARLKLIDQKLEEWVESKKESTRIISRSMPITLQVLYQIFRERTITMKLDELRSLNINYEQATELSYYLSYSMKKENPPCQYTIKIIC
jgi:hypothetical protein